MIATVVIIVITLLNIIVYKLRQLVESKVREKLCIPSSYPLEQLCRRFSLAEIQSATHNFDDALVLGGGGFGMVYKGIIDKGATTVAIKRSNPMSKQGPPEFWREIETLSKIRHSHIVSLIGYCNDQDEMIIVYEYMVRGTLADHMHKISRNGGNNSTVPWVQRLKICIGAARGLDYLHTGMGVKERVIHRDVKSSNILLDENWAAKISDFGLSKIGPVNQSCTHVSTNVKGTFGYLDLEYFLTHRLTRKSDVYAFGVVLFEVLCGRPAVDLRLDMEQCSLARWVAHCINEGKLYQIIDPNLIEQILPQSLTTFEQIAHQCLHKFPKQRPTMAEVVVSLERALALQERIDSSLFENKIFNTGGACDNQENADSSEQQHEVINANSSMEQQDVLNAGNDLHEEPIDKIRLLGDGSSKRKQIDGIADSSREQPKVINSGNGIKQIDGILLLGNANSHQSSVNPTKTMAFTQKLRLFFFGRVQGTSGASRVVSKISNSSACSSLTIPSYSEKSSAGTGSSLPTPRSEGEILSSPNLKAFSFKELRNATRNFRPDRSLGEGGFSYVFKGWIDEQTLTAAKTGSGMVIAVKKIKPEGFQGHKEWLTQVNYLGQLHHPNLVKLFGYCLDGENRLLVYEFMPKGSLENHLFRRGPQPLSWATRIKVGIGAARGLSFLHDAEEQVIYRDFKASNILLDAEFNAKLSDFGLAKAGPTGDRTHVSTQVMGTHGYAAPEYVATGRLTAKSDVYSFGVVLLELLSGRRAVDKTKVGIEQNLVDWAKPYLGDKRKLFRIMDTKLEGQYPQKGAYTAATIALQCLSIEPKVRPRMAEVLMVLEQIQSPKNAVKHS